MDAAGAIAHVRQHMQTNMTDEQMRLVNRFAPLAARVAKQEMSGNS